MAMVMSASAVQLDFLGTGPVLLLIYLYTYSKFSFASFMNFSNMYIYIWRKKSIYKFMNTFCHSAMTVKKTHNYVNTRAG